MDNPLDHVFSAFNSAMIYRHIGITLLCWLLMIAAVCIDMWDGILTARTVKEKIRSNSLRKTISKAGDYWRVLVFGLFFDVLGSMFPVYTLPYMTMLLTAGVLGIEFKSLIEHNKRKKSEAAKLPDVVKQIIECTSEADAAKLIKLIKNVEK